MYTGISWGRVIMATAVLDNLSHLWH